MKKHGVLFDMINNSISFLRGYFLHFAAPFVTLFTIPTVETEIIFMATQQDILPNRILKKYLVESLDDFLGILEKISNKKKSDN